MLPWYHFELIFHVSSFQVKDKNEFKFDPAKTVLEICRIYINLEKCDGFCLSVSQDGRSYSPKLFEYTEQVLGALNEIKIFAINELIIQYFISFFHSSHRWRAISWRNERSSPESQSS